VFRQFKINPKDFNGPVLVTGAGGCIGSWVLTLLSDAGVPVAAMDLTEDKRRPKLLMADSELAQVPWFTGDMMPWKKAARRRSSILPRCRFPSARRIPSPGRK